MDDDHPGPNPVRPHGGDGEPALAARLDDARGRVAALSEQLALLERRVAEADQDRAVALAARQRLQQSNDALRSELVSRGDASDVSSERDAVERERERVSQVRAEDAVSTMRGQLERVRVETERDLAEAAQVRQLAMTALRVATDAVAAARDQVAELRDEVDELRRGLDQERRRSRDTEATLKAQLTQQRGAFGRLLAYARETAELPEGASGSLAAEAAQPPERVSEPPEEIAESSEPAATVEEQRRRTDPRSGDLSRALERLRSLTDDAEAAGGATTPSVPKSAPPRPTGPPGPTPAPPAPAAPQTNAARDVLADRVAEILESALEHDREAGAGRSSESESSSGGGVPPAGGPPAGGELAPPSPEAADDTWVVPAPAEPAPATGWVEADPVVSPTGESWSRAQETNLTRSVSATAIAAPPAEEHGLLVDVDLPERVVRGPDFSSANLWARSPWLARGLRALADDDAADAGRMFVQLLPAHGFVLGKPVDFDLIIAELGVIAVRVGYGRTDVQERSEPRDDVDFAVTTDLARLGRLVTQRHHWPLGRYPEITRGGRRELGNLTALARAPLSLRALHAAGVSPDPTLLYRVLCASIEPDWVAGSEFVIEHELTGPPSLRCYVTARGGRLKVARQAPGAVDTRLVTDASQMLALLSGLERPSPAVVSGAAGPLAELCGWIARAEGLAS